MIECTITLNSVSDYRILRKILKAFDGATIRPAKRQKGYTIEDSLREAENGEIVGPFTSVKDFMNNLME